MGKGASGAEHRHLRDVAVRREGPERRAHLLERGVRDLQVEPIRVVAREPHRSRDDLEELVAVLADTGGIEELEDTLVEVGIAGAVPGEAFGHRGFSLARSVPP